MMMAGETGGIKCCDWRERVCGILRSLGSLVYYKVESEVWKIEMRIKGSIGSIITQLICLKVLNFAGISNLS
jgi:hypothetical protein